MTTAAVERRVRLALGLEVVDAVRGDPADVEVAWENVPLPFTVAVPLGPGSSVEVSLYDPGMGLPRLDRGARPGRFRIAFTPERTPAPPARLRIVDAGRRYVPRRLEVPYASLATVLAEEAGPGLPAPRSRTVGLFPGACFQPEACSTGIRGRVVDLAGAPVRWVRVEARHPQRNSLLGIAHGDDRGEFLLLLANAPSSLDVPPGLAFSVQLAVSAIAPGTPAPGPLTASPADDPLGDLVREVLPPIGNVDTISSGAVAPPGFTRTATATVFCTVGRVQSPSVPITLP